MARIRSIKPEFWEDDLVGALSREARLLFIASWNLADDAGRLRWTPAYLKASVFMYDHDIDVERVAAVMAELERGAFVVPYTAGRVPQSLAFVRNFGKHQRINRPKPSKLPTPPRDDGGTTRKPRQRRPVPVVPESRTDSLNGSVTESVNESRPDAHTWEQGAGSREQGDGAGSREMEQGESSSQKQAAAAIRAREAPARNGGDDDGQDAALETMRHDLAATLVDDCPPAERRGFEAAAALIVTGDNLTAWKDPTGSQVPWPDRPRLLRLALARCVAESTWRGNALHSALRYVLPQQLDPHPAPRSAAPPGSEAAGVTDELPGRDRVAGSTGGLERAGARAAAPLDPARLPVTDDDIRAWQLEHQEEAEMLRQSVESEVPDMPPKFREVSIAEQLRPLIAACIRRERSSGVASG